MALFENLVSYNTKIKSSSMVFYAHQGGNYLIKNITKSKIVSYYYARGIVLQNGIYCLNFTEQL